MPRRLPPDHPAVGTIEAVLVRGLGPPIEINPQQRLKATHALRICACVAYQDAPIWLLFEDDAGGGWCRLTGSAVAELPIDAPLIAGGHADPDQVLRWVTGDAKDPWGVSGDGSGDARVLAALSSRLV